MHDKTLNTARRLLHGLTLRAGSLLLTVYGDAFAPRRQHIWLGSLIQLMEPFGLSARLVRTSAFRLTAADWFTTQRIGRRSFYGLSGTGLPRVQHADRRIYEFALPPWNGHWTIVMLDARMRASARRHLQRELSWESFGQLSPTVFAHPHVDPRSLEEIVRAAQAQDQVAVLDAQSLPPFATHPLQTIMHDTFRLGMVAQGWQQFLQRFAPIADGAADLGPAEAFFVRTLLVHEYRRVLLRDPNLPQPFLPAGWPGIEARQLCRALYGALLAPSEAFLCAQVQTAEGPLARTPDEIARRAAPR